MNMMCELLEKAEELAADMVAECLIKGGEDCELRIYLASPYTHPDPLVRESRVLAVNYIVSKLTELGVLMYGPITSSHHITVTYGIKGTWEYWQELDASFINLWATEVWVLCIPGWEESTGVQAEIKLAEAAGKPIRYIKYN